MCVLGCSPGFDEMRSRLDRLELPSGYELVWERQEGAVPGFFGDGPRVSRRYKTEKAFTTACEEIQVIAAAFPGPNAGTSVRNVSDRPVCSVWFEVDGYPAGIVVVVSPEAVAEFGFPLGTIWVDAKIRHPWY